MSYPIHLQSYAELLIYLDEYMYERCRAFVQETNPGWCLLQKKGWKPALASLFQYRFLPANIRSFLENGRKRMTDAGWVNVVDKLNFNINQEIGSHNGQFQSILKDPDLFLQIQPKSHYAIFLEMLGQDFDLDFSTHEPSMATTLFLNKITNAICGESPAFVGGVLFGLEHTAIPELSILYNMVKAIYQAINGRPLQSKLTQAFFTLHLEYFEAQHDLDLKKSLFDYIKNPTQKLEFHDGFILVLDCMDQWWQGFCADARAEQVAP